MGRFTPKGRFDTRALDAAHAPLPRWALILRLCDQGFYAPYRFAEARTLRGVFVMARDMNDDRQVALHIDPRSGIILARADLAP